MSVTLGDLRGMIEEAALGADALLEIVLPRFAKAFDGDDLRRFVLHVDSQVGYGSERSLVRLNAEPVGAPCTDVADVGELLAHVTRAGIEDAASVMVLVDGEADDRADGQWPVVTLGVVRSFNTDELPVLVLRLDQD